MLPLSLHDPGVVLVHKPNGEGEVPEARKIEASKTANRTPTLPISLAFFPESGAFLTPGSGIRIGDGKKCGSGFQYEHPGSYFRELTNNFLGLKYFKLNSLMRIRIWDLSDPGSGMEISDPK
jgi:hypothetical protein